MRKTATRPQPERASVRSETFPRSTPIDQLPEFLRVDEVAQYTRTSRAVIYEMVKRGDLRGVFFGRLLRISREALAVMANGSAGSEKR